MIFLENSAFERTAITDIPVEKKAEKSITNANDKIFLLQTRMRLGLGTIF